MRLNPHFLICETTNIFFNTAWILRAAGWRGNAVVLTFEYLFAFTFIPIRIINLTLVIWVLQTQVYKSSFCLISISYFRVISLKFDFDWIHPSFLSTFAGNDARPGQVHPASHRCHAVLLGVQDTLYDPLPLLS
jgi:hypothetical protein